MRSLESRRALLSSQSFYVEGQSFPPSVKERQGDMVTPRNPGKSKVLEDSPVVGESKRSLQVPFASWFIVRWTSSFLTWIRAAEALRALYMTILQLVLCAIVSHYFSHFFPFAFVENTVLRAPRQAPLSPPSDMVYSSQLHRVLHAFSNGELVREDLALASAGGAIVPILTSTTPRNSYFSWILMPNALPPYPPSVVLHSLVRLGTCWHVYSQSAHIGISFQRPLIITHITIDHVIESPEDSPRNVVIWGLLEGDTNLAKYNASDAVTESDGHLTPPPGLLAAVKSHSRASLVKLVQFQFEHPFRSFAAIQSFPINPGFDEIDFGVIVVDIRNNWGAPLTCVYRIRVHGHSVEVE